MHLENNQSLSHTVSGASKKTLVSKSIFTAFGAKTSGGGLDDNSLADLGYTPTIQDQNRVTKEWWDEMNPNYDAYLPISCVKQLLIKRHLAQDNDQAGQIIEKIFEAAQERAQQSGGT